MTELENIDGVGPATAEKLEDAGFSPESVAVSSAGELSSVISIDESQAEIIIEQAREYALDGQIFTSASNVQPSADFTSLDVPEEVSGWKLFLHNSSHIGWESPAGYRLFIEGHRSRIWGSLPHEDHEEPREITWDQVLRPRMGSPEEAVNWAENWMTMRAIDPETGLSEYTGISDKLDEHLQMVYAINTPEELYTFIQEDEDQVKKIIGSQYFDDLKTELEERF